VKRGTHFHRCWSGEHSQVCAFSALRVSVSILHEAGNCTSQPATSRSSHEPLYVRSPRMRRASWMSLGMIVTRFA
jgi:hypothetical protein